MTASQLRDRRSFNVSFLIFSLLPFLRDYDDDVKERRRIAAAEENPGAVNAGSREDEMRFAASPSIAYQQQRTSPTATGHLAADVIVAFDQ